MYTHQSVHLSDLNVMSTYGKDTTNITVDYLYKRLDEYWIVDWSFVFQEFINVCKSFKREQNKIRNV